MEAYKPPKHAALQYLGQAQAPVDKYVHISSHRLSTDQAHCLPVIHHGSREAIVDYLMGRLTVTAAITIRCSCVLGV